MFVILAYENGCENAKERRHKKRKGKRIGPKVALLVVINKEGVEDSGLYSVFFFV